MTTITQRAERFAQLHAGPDLFVIPNPWDVGAAQILAGLGYSCLATTSAGLAFSMGLRDDDAAVGRDAALAHAAQIVESTPLPVSADLENGFGHTPEEVARTITLAGEAGLCGGSIEDATADHDWALYDRSLAVERIAAAVEAARALPHTFTLTARTEGFIRGAPDLDESLARIAAFEQAGADVLFVPGLPDLGAIRTVCESVRTPVNVVAGLAGMKATLADLEAAGVRRVSLGSSLSRIAYGAMLDAATEIRDHGTFGYTEQLKSVATWDGLVGG
ncbi:MAG: 2-methylisocitrate lyase [Phycisphaeraceae bacterium]|nr:MAG: 2-methylisocitrate lyase [Phycisphaeraceae bacterium]